MQALIRDHYLAEDNAKNGDYLVKKEMEKMKKKKAKKAEKRQPKEYEEKDSTLTRALKRYDTSESLLPGTEEYNRVINTPIN